MYIKKFIKTITLTFLLLVLVSCGKNEDKPSVEVLKFLSGIFVDVDGKYRFKETQDVPYKIGQSFGWHMYIRSNKENITYTDVIHLSDVGVWSDNLTVSTDRKSASGTKTVPNTGHIETIWAIAEGDPKGEISIDIYIDNKIVHTFYYNMK